MIREIDEFIPKKNTEIGIVEVDDILEKCEDKINKVIEKAIDSDNIEVQKTIDRVLELEKEIETLIDLLEDEKIECYNKIKMEVLK